MRADSSGPAASQKGLDYTGPFIVSRRAKPPPVHACTHSHEPVDLFDRMEDSAARDRVHVSPWLAAWLSKMN